MLKKYSGGLLDTQMKFQSMIDEISFIMDKIWSNVDEVWFIMDETKRIRAR